MWQSRRQWREVPLHCIRARHPVNEGFGKEIDRKGKSMKRSGPFSEPPESENESLLRSSPSPNSAPRKFARHKAQQIHHKWIWRKLTQRWCNADSDDLKSWVEKGESTWELWHLSFVGPPSTLKRWVAWGGAFADQARYVVFWMFAGIEVYVGVLCPWQYKVVFQKLSM